MKAMTNTAFAMRLTKVCQGGGESETADGSNVTDIGTLVEFQVGQ
jgi:hypothetical protein